MMLTETDQRVHKSFEKDSFHPILRIAAKIISYIFHPLFIPVYVGWFLIYQVRLFPGNDAWGNTRLVISMFVNYTFLPLMVILLLKGLGFISSVYLHTRKDRIIPYVIAQICYFWMWYVFRNQDIPKELVMFAMGVFLTSAFGLIFNAYRKISMHAMAVGLVVTYLVFLGFMTYLNYGPYIAIALLIAGLVCTARLIVSDHTQGDIYIGLLVGAVAQVAGYLFS